MKWSLFALCIGFCIDLLIGDPHGLPHPVAAIGHLISLLERLFRRLFPKTPGGERAAGACIWILTALIAAALPALLLWGCARVSVWLRLAVESVMCGQILAAKSLRDESMKVYAALKHGSLDEARQAVSMIVGRDVARLDARGVMRAAVETVAENTSDGVIAPMLFLAIGGAPLGFFYKAVNTMDSMLGYVEPPYKDIGLVPARMDDVFNFIASNVTENVRDVEGIVASLLAYSTAFNRMIDLPLTKQVVSRVVKLEKKQVSVESIQDVVCKYYNLELAAIQTNSRKREIVQARQVTMYLAKKYTDSSFSHIGKIVGKRDHATVLHACKTVKDQIETNKSFRSSVEEIEALLKA